MWIWSTLTSVGSSITQWLIQSSVPAWLVVVGSAVAFGLGRWGLPRHEQPRVVTDTIYVDAPLELADLPEPTTPNQVTEYDTSKTRTECIEVPTWLASRPRSIDSRTASPPKVQQRPQRAASVVTQLPKRGQQLGGPPYAITPMTTGRPSLSVGSGQVTLSGYLPTGEGRKWTYDLPQDKWGIGLDGSITAAGEWIQATSTLGISHMTGWGPIHVKTRLGGGYGALMTGRYRAGPLVRADISLSYRW